MPQQVYTRQIPNKTKQNKTAISNKCTRDRIKKITKNTNKKRIQCIDGCGCNTQLRQQKKCIVLPTAGGLSPNLPVSVQYHSIIFVCVFV